MTGHIHVTEEELRASAALSMERITLKGQSTRSFRFFQHRQCGMHGIGGIFNEDRSTTYACVKTTASLDKYGGYGGIGYYHVSDTYIALFSHFIPCGVWEGSYILDMFEKEDASIKPETVHGDTQAQSTTVFGLAHLLGISLMPRIRNWKDLKLFRPDPEVQYIHLDSLFGDNVVDWDLIATHWQDLLRVVISIQEGKQGLTPLRCLRI